MQQFIDKQEQSTEDGPAANALSNSQAPDGIYSDSKCGDNLQVAGADLSTEDARGKELFSSFKERVCGACFDMIAIHKGTFRMGNNASYEDEKPAHPETVDDFYLSKTEVVISQFNVFIADTHYQTDAERNGNSYIWTDHGWEKKKGVSWRCDGTGNIRKSTDPDFPVVHVSWNDAMAFCQWLSDKTRKVYRLPSEPEWEYSAGGGTCSRTTWSGTDDESKLNNYAWFRMNSDRSIHPVGEKLPNALGLYDMSGNVWEWCREWYGCYDQDEPEDPAGPSAHYDRASRGGSWLYDPYHCRVSFRHFATPDFSDGAQGFRLALDV